MRLTEIRSLPFLFAMFNYIVLIIVAVVCPSSTHPETNPGLPMMLLLDTPPIPAILEAG